MTADTRIVSHDLTSAKGARIGEGLIRVFVLVCGVFVVVSTVVVIGFLARTGVKGVREIGLGQLVSGLIWKPEANRYGGLPLLLGTLVSATGAAILGATPAVLGALWITEFSARRLRTPFRRLMEITSAIPSVVYGWLALAYLVPQMERVARGIYGEEAGVGGEGLASASVLLAVMIVPTVTILSLDALSRVHQSLRDASSALGA